MIWCDVITPAFSPLFQCVHAHAHPLPTLPFAAVPWIRVHPHHFTHQQPQSTLLLVTCFVWSFANMSRMQLSDPQRTSFASLCVVSVLCCVVLCCVVSVLCCVVSVLCCICVVSAGAEQRGPSTKRAVLYKSRTGRQMPSPTNPSGLLLQINQHTRRR